MIGRRLILKGLLAMASGDGLSRPMNAPPAAELTPGVQPGAQQPIVIANKVIITGPKGGEFVYSSTSPALGTLVASSVPAAGFDGVGNAVLAGDTVYRNLGGGVWLAANLNPTAATFGLGTMVGIFSATGPAGPWTLQSGLNGNNAGQIWLAAQDGSVLQLSNGGGVTLAPFSGQGKFTIQNGTGTVVLQGTAVGVPQVVNGNDLGTYTLGQLAGIVGSNTLINSTTPITLVTVANIAPGFYRVSARVRFTAAAAGVVQPFNIRFLGTATCSAIELCTTLIQEAANVTSFPGVITAQNQDPSTVANWANSATGRWEVSGIIHVSAAGSWVLSGRQGTSAADETFTVSANSWMEIRPVG